jgi:hypothetical protein
MVAGRGEACGPGMVVAKQASGEGELRNRGLCPTGDAAAERVCQIMLAEHASLEHGHAHTSQACTPARASAAQLPSSPHKLQHLTLCVPHPLPPTWPGYQAPGPCQC